MSVKSIWPGFSSQRSWTLQAFWSGIKGEKRCLLAAESALIRSEPKTACFLKQKFPWTAASAVMGSAVSIFPFKQSRSLSPTLAVALKFSANLFPH